jgi:phospholipid/cholesterol/gamma-HCH transport system substrate-binding protein
MERPNAKGANNFIVGLFVFIGLLVGAGFIVFMGGSTSFGGETHVKTIFKDVRGLNVGAPVYLAGIQIGRVSDFEFPDGHSNNVQDDTGQAIVTVLSIYKEHLSRIRADSEASISTMGVLGDKVIVISPGSKDAPPIKKGEFLASQQPRDIGDYFQKGGNLVNDLSQAAQNLSLMLEELHQDGKLRSTIANLEKSSKNLADLTQNLKDPKSGLGALIYGGPNDNLTPALKSLREILAKVDRGEGTLGALINDPSLHEDMRLLLGGAKRSQMVRFLIRQAIASGEKKQGGSSGAKKAQ